MLRDLHLRNLAVVDEATIELGPGLNVLTGETGAGKSIVVDSLALLAGVRADAELIRTGAEDLRVVGRFEPPGEGWRSLLAAAGVEAGDDGHGDAGEVIVRREISRSGRNRVFVNDQPVTLRLLTELAPHLLRIHGQREELGLVAPELQRTWLDHLGGTDGEALRAKVADAFARHRALAERLERLTSDDRARRERVDLLRFQASEIDDAAVVAGEEDELRRERGVLRNAEAIRTGLAVACEALFDRDGAVYDALGEALEALGDVAEWESEATAWSGELDEVRIRVGELERALRRRLDEIEADPRRLDDVEDRLATLERLFRKYGATSTDVLAHRRAVAAELADLEGDESTAEELAAEAEAAVAAYRAAALELSAARGRWAKKLAERVHRELRELALGKARFAVALERRRRAGSPLLVDGEPVELGPDGVDHVVYLFSPNPGEELRPLAKVASGGELSRLYLAVQLAVRGGESGADATLVFDEVDTGIGGAEAAALGAKLRRLARGGQILAVTHLPQVASQGDAHFKVAKEVKKGRTHTRVTGLVDEARVEEVARMLAGAELTDLSLSHARELIAAGEATTAA